jgi:flagellar biosynthesis chaperone FliJ
MAFRFALAPLLRLRQSLERQQAMRLSEASLAVARAQEMVSRMEVALAESARSGDAALRAGQSAAELQFALLARENMKAQRQKVQAEFQRLELERQRVAGEYRRAYQEREVLETLARRQHSVYVQEQLQREQRDLDASYLMQKWRKSKDRR